MSAGIGALQAVIDQPGGHEVSIERMPDGRILARSTGAHATWKHKVGIGPTIGDALYELARKHGIDLILDAATGDDITYTQS